MVKERQSSSDSKHAGPGTGSFESIMVKAAAAQREGKEEADETVEPLETQFYYGLILYLFD
ncbi:hypothetical protein DXT99_23140 [Pontibacter diazotrophicus]|uniref:Uncharacterized protein n=1 Tax=Pontibacter diazotrophicus TaxID=1400979 RepID=A0A3D8L3N7_9BACT|nr:hypothetical protein DXT99_23140 [Pontibacter diazotrophicus]